MTLASTVHGSIDDRPPVDALGDIKYSQELTVRGPLRGNTQTRSIIEFNISGLAPLASATLKLTRTGGTLAASRTFEVFGYTGNGTLDKSDYSEITTSVGTFDHFNQATADFDVTAFINAQLGNTWAGLVILWADDPKSEYIDFGDFRVGGKYPTLEIVSAVPLPAALPMFFVALGGLGIMGQRRKRHTGAAAASSC